MATGQMQQSLGEPQRLSLKLESVLPIRLLLHHT